MAACSSVGGAPNAVADGGVAGTKTLGQSCGDARTCRDAHTSRYAIVTEGASCPSGYKLGATYSIFPAAKYPHAECKCECGPPIGAPTCTGGPVEIGVSIDSSCGNASQINSGHCQTTLAGDAAYAKATPRVANQVDCVATVVKTPPPALPEFPRALVCVPELETREDCTGALVCEPDVLAPARECISAGPPSNACEGEYPTYVALADDPRDKRGCNDDCACETTATCTNARLEFHDPNDPNCSKAPKTTIAADGACHKTGYTTSWLVYQADLVSPVECHATRSPKPVGGVGGVPYHFCCK